MTGQTQVVVGAKRDQGTQRWVEGVEAVGTAVRFGGPQPVRPGEIFQLGREDSIEGATGWRRVAGRRGRSGFHGVGL